VNRRTATVADLEQACHTSRFGAKICLRSISLLFYSFAFLTFKFPIKYLSTVISTMQ